MTYTCYSGFHLVGHGRLSCLADSSWSAHLPSCQPVRCSTLKVPAYGRLSSMNTTFQSVVKVQCLPGFVLAGSATRVCEANGQWNVSPPVCIPIRCPQLHASPHAVIVSSNNSFSGNWHGRCVVGYQKSSGSSVRVCLANGNWSGEEFVCQGKDWQCMYLLL